MRDPERWLAQLLFGRMPRTALPEEPEAWLEREGQEHIVQGSCSIGRATLSSLILDSAKISRLHAIIHSERTCVFWLVDLGSSNGTYLNRRRIHEPIQLRNGDKITVGDNTFIFRYQLSGKKRS
jgi:pSer/pThr/pTyr-binding forkhead associated (FHA) protein